MRALLVLVVLTSTAGAVAPDLGLTATTRGSSVVLTFENRTSRAIRMPIRVRAGETMYDWLTVKLTRDKVTRSITFVHTRTKSVMEYADLAAGATLAEPIDLAPWAFSDGEPLAPGTYAVEATWDSLHDADGPKVKLTATTTLTIAAPVDTSCTGAGTTDVTLLVRQVPKTTLVEVGLHNAGTTTQCVPSRVAAGEDQNDWLTITVDKHAIHFDDERTKAGVVRAELAPGATVYTRYDVAAWAARKRNGVALPHGTVWADAVYDASTARDTWRGKLAAGFPLVLP